jgi:upstream activation factor subunit UAF30
MAKKKATKKKAAKKTTKKAAPKMAKKMAAPKMAKKATSKRTPSAAFMKPLMPSDALAAIVGAKPLPRTEVVKKLWAYIRKNNLQDSKNRRMIHSDDKLRPVFGGKGQLNMFEMTKYVSKHLS